MINSRGKSNIATSSLKRQPTRHLMARSWIKIRVYCLITSTNYHFLPKLKSQIKAKDLSVLPLNWASFVFSYNSRIIKPGKTSGIFWFVCITSKDRIPYETWTLPWYKNIKMMWKRVWLFRSTIFINNHYRNLKKV